MGLSLWHLLIVVLVIVILFGPGRLPRAMEDLAKGVKAFRNGLKDEDDKASKDKDSQDKSA